MVLHSTPLGVRSMVGHYPGFNSVIPIEVVLICVQCQFRISAATKINILLILCHRGHDFQLKMLGGQAPPKPAGGAGSAPSAP